MGQHQQRSKGTTTAASKKKGDRDTYNSHLSMDEMASFHLFLALIAKQDYT